MPKRLLHNLITIFIVCALSQTVHAHNHEHRHYEFIPNKGQENSTVNYTVKLKGGKLFVEDKSLLFHFVDNSSILQAHLHQNTNSSEFIKGHAYRMTWVNARTPQYENANKTTHYYNYFRGKDQSKWKGGIHAYESLILKKLYPGIDVLFETDEQEHLKYTYKVAPHASPMQIIQQYEGIEQLKLSKEGNLMLTTNVGVQQELAPVAWQVLPGKGLKKIVPCKFKLVGKKIMYEFPQGYDEAFELIIDPVLIFGSYSGSVADNFGMTATYDESGHLYSGGIAFDTGYPTTIGAYDVTSNPDGSSYGVTDVVLTKYSPTGSSLIYSTYLGGGTISSGTETVHSLIVNKNDELMCFGATSSTDFPTTSTAFSSTHSGGSTIQFYYNGVYYTGTGTDIYVTKFNSTGTALIGSTYIGGASNDGVNYKISSGTYASVAAYDSLTSNYGDQFRGEIMLDASDNIVVASTTRSADFPTATPYQATRNGQSDAVVFKFSPDLSTLLFSTYLGGSGLDAGYSVKLDGAGNVFVTGGTTSSDFPTTAGTVSPGYNGGKTDGFISKLSPGGSALVASSFIGTSVYDQSMFVEIDKDDNVYMYGNTLGTTTFPIINATYSNANSGQFIVKWSNDLSTIDFSTLIGNGTGAVNISPSAFLVDVCGNIYISGWGANILQTVGLTGMPVTADAFQPSSGDGFNFYIACFQRNMSGLLYASYFGGGISHEHVDGGTSRFDKYGIIYQSVCAGCGSNDDFPTTPDAWSQTNNSSNCNNGVFKFDFEIAPVADFATDLFEGCSPLTITFTNSSPADLDYLWIFGNGDTSSVIFNPTITYSDTGTYTVMLITEDSLCGLIDTAVKVINVYPEVSVTANTDTSFCGATMVNLIANSNGTSSQYIWSTSPTFSDTLNTPLTDSTILVNVVSDSAFYVQTTNGYCEVTDTVVINIVNLDPEITGVTVSCAGDSTVLTAVNLFAGETYTIDWTPNTDILSGDGTPVVIVSPPDTATYTVTFTSPFGCTATESYLVVPVASGLATATAFADAYTIASGESTTLHAIPTGPYTYNWIPSTGLSSTTSADPIASPTETTIYTVEISLGGCTRTDTVIVKVRDFVCGEKYIYIPNAFTPNGDGTNDVLYVRGRNITQVYFAIFERWGEKVFETNDMNIGWDGKVNGKDADPAVFDYYLKVVCAEEEEFFQKGNITLIR